MSHGMLTQRGRWQLKTGRRKFTAQSLMQAPKIVGLHEEYEARSYESQWVLDRIPQTNECMNHWYQELLAAINGKVTVPQPMLDYKLDFRWIAAYRNMRFLAISLIVFLFFWKLFG
ncbi:hypothetical protein EC988_009719 [Linderina pennispora]|nr:hypothetical protein EC988_009719 [Linderina pennispora]